MSGVDATTLMMASRPKHTMEDVMAKITILQTRHYPEGAEVKAVKVVVTDRSIAEIRGSLKDGFTARRYRKADAALPQEILSDVAFLFG